MQQPVFAFPVVGSFLFCLLAFSTASTAGDPSPIGERHDLSQPVTEVPLADVLAAMRAGEDVVFVDVREPEEFAEVRIPGAINIPLRDVDEDAVADIADADLVVSYCIKDFRGYETAKAFWRAGVDHAAIVNPFGLRGWIASGLPVAGSQHANEREAMARLDQCLADSSCVGESP